MLSTIVAIPLKNRVCYSHLLCIAPFRYNLAIIAPEGSGRLLVVGEIQLKVLLVKTSSLGDVFHTLPAVQDAFRQVPDIEFHWVVEEGFSEVPEWHPAVTRVIPVAWRRWRKSLKDPAVRAEMKAFYRSIREEKYDLVLDAQGLIKSAVFTRLARGTKAGLDRASLREPLAALAYKRRIRVPKGQHAILRTRQLFARALNYRLPEQLAYGIDKSRWERPDIEGEYWVFLHGTTWVTKLWPETYWRSLAELGVAQGKKVVLLWGNDEERERAERIVDGIDGAQVLPRMPLNEVSAWLAYAEGVVGVDSGLSHLAAAMETGMIAIFGSTDATLTGVLGPHCEIIKSELECAPCRSKQCLLNEPGDIQPPCYREITPERVKDQLLIQISEA